VEGRQIIDSASFGPEALKVIGQAFDEAWASIAEKFPEGVDAETARVKLAVAILAVATEDSRDAAALQQAALRTFASVPIERSGGLDKRFCEVMDAAPVMIWVSGKDQGCVWFNRPWLTFTGRSMEVEIGDGWTQGVHPNDRKRCLAIYTSHFEAREKYRMQYRLRGADGAYCWIDDTGIPRYADDGTFLGFIGSCVDVTHLKALERETKELSVRLVNLQEEERQRFAQELHDSTAQHLVAVSLTLTALRSTGSANDIETRLWDEVDASLTDALQEIRTLSHEMHPLDLGIEGLTRTLRRYVDGYSNRSGLAVTLRSISKVDSLPLRVQHALFRIVQEALADVHRRARATQVLVKLRHTGDRLHLIVADDGCTRSGRAGAPTRTGIYGVRARARQFGGDVKICTGRRGTTLHVFFQLQDAHAFADVGSDHGVI
jgi:PAS domain S-box-containing protein